MSMQFDLSERSSLVSVADVVVAIALSHCWLSWSKASCNIGFTYIAVHVSMLSIDKQGPAGVEEHDTDL